MRLIDGDALYDALREAGMVFALRMVEAAPTITPPPNDPLTLEQLREMDGEPVYVRYLNGGGEWGIVETMYGYDLIEIRFRNGLAAVGGMHGLFSRGADIYRRKPEEGT